MEELKSIRWVTRREWVLNYACEYASTLLQKCQWPLRWSRHEALYNVNNKYVIGTMFHWSVFLPLDYSQAKMICLSKCRFRYLFCWQTLANLKRAVSNSLLYHSLCNFSSNISCSDFIINYVPLFTKAKNCYPWVNCNCVQAELLGNCTEFIDHGVSV